MNIVIYNRLDELSDNQILDIIQFLCPNFEDLNNIDLKKLLKINEKLILDILRNVSFMECPSSLLKNDMKEDFRNARTLNNYAIDESKSAIQKYIRRGLFDKAIYFTIELDLFSDTEIKFYSLQNKKIMRYADNASRTSSVRSNMIHRLMIIAAEDISIANPTLPYVMNKYLKSWFELREELLNEFSPDKLEKQRSDLIKIVKLMCNSKKIRFPSYMRNTWFKKENQEYIKTFFPSLIKRKYDPHYKLKYDYVRENHVNQYFNEKKHVEYFHKLCIFVENKDDKAFKYFGKLRFIKLDKKINKRSKSEYLLWDYIEKASPILLGKELYDSLKRSIDVLREWYEECTSENWLFLFQALSYLVRKDQMSKLIVKESENSISKNSISNEIYSINLQNKKIEIDDYCIDIHTRRGKINKKTKFDFGICGSYVSNEAHEIIEDVYKQAYVSCYKYWNGKGVDLIKPIPVNEIKELEKMNVEDSALIKSSIESFRERETMPLFTDKIDREELVFQDIVRAQLLCSKSRPDVYFATSDYFEFKNVVVKGPYINEETISETEYITSEIRKFEGLNFIPFQIIELYPTSLEVMKNPESFGTRTKVDMNKKYKYFVSQNMCVPNDKKYDIPTELKESKLWKPTKVADMYKLKLKNGNIEEITSNNARLQLLLVLSFRYIYQVPDTCERNIIYCREKVYSVDNEGYKRENSLKNLYSKPLPLLKKKLFEEFIEDHWEELLEYYKKWDKVNDTPLWVKNNLKFISNKDNLLKLL